MDIILLIFLSSGLFLGWTLGANDAANVFGTAVGSRMIRFSTAAIVCSIFVILGATISGSGAAHTLGKLGEVNALGGAFIVSLSAGLTVLMMTRFHLPVSTGQAVVGAIIGWNIFVGIDTETKVVVNILSTWILCPIISAFIAVVLHGVVKWFLNVVKPHILTLDWFTRLALIVIGAFGSYSLGANNIANVMGVFVNAINFDELVLGSVSLDTAQQLFLIGAVAIAVGVFTYSKQVMLTVGNNMMPLTPITAGIVVMSHSIVLFLFASEGLEFILATNGLPTIPLVPVSSSQAVVGAIIGIGLLKGGQQLDWKVLGKIASGWVTTPPIAMVCCLTLLFFSQNIFTLSVDTPMSYHFNTQVKEQIAGQGVNTAELDNIKQEQYSSIRAFKSELANHNLSDELHQLVVKYSRLSPIRISVKQLPQSWLENLDQDRLEAIIELDNRRYQYEWQVEHALQQQSDRWSAMDDSVLNKHYNRRLQRDHASLLNYAAFKESPIQ
jgi:inorganic phosphate transporter, PiT family